jgi:preprotein translocase SecE subunit
MATKKKGQDADTTAKEASAGGQDGAVGNAAAAKPLAKEQRPHAEDGNESKKAQSKDEGAGGLLKTMSDFQQFLKGVLVEFGKISWPSRGQVIQETTTVLCLVAIITVMVLAFDWFLGHAVFGPIEHWARLHGGGVGNGQ